MLLRGTTIVSTLTLLSRLLGFGRDLLVAFLLGSSLFADAFFVAFRIPNLLRSFIAEGALTAAFTPVFASACAESKNKARLTFRNIAGLLLLITIPIVCAVIYFASEIVAAFAPGFTDDPTTFALCVQLTQIMAPYILFVSLIAMINSALNTLGVFGTSAMAQVVMNLVLIGGGLCALLATDSQTVTWILAFSVLVGGFAQITSQLPTCRKQGLSIAPLLLGESKARWEVLRLMLPATLGASIYQITIFFGTLMASLLPTGSVSWLFYADRIAQFPMGIFSIALASVLLPTLSNAAASSDHENFNQNLTNSLRYTSFCIIPVATAIVYFAEPIITLLFERGEFSRYATLQTATALQALALGLWASSFHSMIVRAFIARKNTVTPTIIGACTLIITILTALLLIGPLSTGQGSNWIVTSLAHIQTLLYQSVSISFSLGHIGLATASTIAAFFSMILAVLLFSFSSQSLCWAPVVRATAISITSSLLTVFGISRLPLSLLHPFLQITIGVGLGICVYGFTSYLLKSREAKELHALCVSQLKRPRGKL